MRAGRYETALAKQVWLHDHGLAINPAFSSVRVSFWLASWKQLANNYPPALAKLIEVRDQATQDVLQGEHVQEQFAVLKSINELLGDQSSTVETFKTLDRNQPAVARSLFLRVKTALIETKAYDLFAKYTDPKADYEKLARSYQRMKEFAASHPAGEKSVDYEQKKFTYETTTLVAVLTVLGRDKEAKTIAKSARAELQDADFHAGLKAARRGVVPTALASVSRLLSSLSIKLSAA